MHPNFGKFAMQFYAVPTEIDVLHPGMSPVPSPWLIHPSLVSSWEHRLPVWVTTWDCWRARTPCSRSTLRYRSCWSPTSSPTFRSAAAGTLSDTEAEGSVSAERSAAAPLQVHSLTREWRGLETAEWFFLGGRAYWCRPLRLLVGLQPGVA